MVYKTVFHVLAIILSVFVSSSARSNHGEKLRCAEKNNVYFINTILEIKDNTQE